MNRQSGRSTRALVSLSVFALMAVAIVATEAETGRAAPSTTYSQPDRERQGTPLLIRLVGLVIKSYST